MYKEMIDPLIHTLIFLSVIQVHLPNSAICVFLNRPQVAGAFLQNVDDKFPQTPYARTHTPRLVH
jgi:hypothetical protein